MQDLNASSTNDPVQSNKNCTIYPNFHSSTNTFHIGFFLKEEVLDQGNSSFTLYSTMTHTKSDKCCTQCKFTFQVQYKHIKFI